MADLFFGLPSAVQALLKGLAVILVIFPIAAACSMAERKVSAWIQGRPGPNRALPPFLAWIPGIGILQRLGVFHLAADGAKFVFKEEPVSYTHLIGHVDAEAPRGLDHVGPLRNRDFPAVDVDGDEFG